MHSWIRDCESNHELCANRGDIGSWYPTRLIDLELPDERSENVETLRAKLVRGDDVPLGTRYITLSHRWNDANQLKLTKELLDRWLQALPTDELSPIFRDFVIVARRLGIRHVWIDSICIIQDGDDGADWSYQAGIMDQVYRNSFCNISADWGSSTDGLFVDRDTSQFSQPDILLRLQTDKEADEVTYSYLVHDTRTWDREVTKAPLSSRGWVIQEWILPARTLHFCRKEVFFECCERAACERYFRGMPLFGSTMSPVHFKDLRLKGRSVIESEDIEHWEPALGQKVYYYNAWTRIRDAYSSCSLTFTTDKLVAISGICRYLKLYLSDDTYVAGVWLFNLASQMTWFCDSEKLRLRRAEDRDVSKGRIAWDTSNTKYAFIGSCHGIHGSKLLLGIRKLSRYGR